MFGSGNTGFTFGQTPASTSTNTAPTFGSPSLFSSPTSSFGGSVFGQTNIASPQQQQTSLFGSTNVQQQPKPQSAFGSFGATGFNQNQPAQPTGAPAQSGFLFGSSQAAAPQSGFTFRSPATQQTTGQSTGIFGQTTAQTTTQQPTLFGQQQPAGSTSAAPGSLFGAKPATTSATTEFGGFNTSTFNQPSTNQQQPSFFQPFQQPSLGQNVTTAPTISSGIEFYKLFEYTSNIIQFFQRLNRSCSNYDRFNRSISIIKFSHKYGI